MKDTIIFNCYVCGETKECEFLPIYVVGSEGLEICQECKNDLTEYLRTKKRERIHKELQARKVKK